MKSYEKIISGTVSFILSGILILFTLSCGHENSENQIRILSDFDKGSIGLMKQVAQGNFRGWTNHCIKQDKIGDQYYWFYFQVVNAGGKSLTFELNNMTGIYRGNTHEVFTDYTQPVYSYDQEEWYRVKDVRYFDEEKRFIFKFTSEHDTIWFAYSHPYSWGRYQEVLSTLRENPRTEIEQIGTTVLDRPLQLVRISNRDPGEKRNILLTAVQHAGEDEGGYLLEGLMRFLASGTSEADSILSRCDFYLVPVMNPDGIFHGLSRYNASMEDLNSEWDDGREDTENPTIEPEVQAMQSWVRNFLSDKNIDLFIDVHCHTQKNRENLFLYEDARMKDIAERMSSRWGVSGRKGTFRGSAASFMFNVHGIPAATIELTQSYVQPEKYLCISDYSNYGQSVARAIGEYFE